MFACGYAQDVYNFLYRECRITVSLDHVEAAASCASCRFNSSFMVVVLEIQLLGVKTGIAPLLSCNVTSIQQIHIQRLLFHLPVTVCLSTISDFLNLDLLNLQQLECWFEKLKDASRE